MSNEVMVPGTGELLDLSASTTDEIATTLASLGEFLSDAARFKRAASMELAERLDHEGRRSAEVGEWKVEVNAPTEKQWDVVRLQVELTKLVEKGRISEDKAARCVRHKPEVVWAEVKTLLSDPRVAPEISLCFEEIQSTRYVKVRHA